MIGQNAPIVTASAAVRDGPISARFSKFRPVFVAVFEGSRVGPDVTWLTVIPDVPNSALQAGIRRAGAGGTGGWAGFAGRIGIIRSPGDSRPFSALLGPRNGWPSGRFEIRAGHRAGYPEG
jgi:hypothetical protein